MSLVEIIRIALAALVAHRMRATLAMLGIIIGVGSVVTMVAFGKGAERDVKDRLARLGTTIIWINPARVQQGGVGTASAAKLTLRDVEGIRENAPNIIGVNYQQDRNMQVVWRDKNSNVQVTGTAENFPEVRGFKIAHGRMFTEAEDHGRKRLAVIGAEVVSALTTGDGADLVGEMIRIGGRSFTVVGVLANRGVTGVGDADNQILIPFETGRFLIFGTDRIQDIWALARSEELLDVAMAEIQLALRRTQRLRTGRPDSFTMRNQSDFLVALSETTQTFTLLLASISAVSLLVGGIGIMNIMLVSVTERTREIGVRKALGATRRSILLQFMTEAVVLCLLGGGAGVAVGVAAAILPQKTMGWNTAIDPKSVAVAFGFASATGIIFGVWPAWRAARLDPVVALRFE